MNASIAVVSIVSPYPHITAHNVIICVQKHRSNCCWYDFLKTQKKKWYEWCFDSVLRMAAPILVLGVVQVPLNFLTWNSHLSKVMKRAMNLEHGESCYINYILIIWVYHCRTTLRALVAVPNLVKMQPNKWDRVDFWLLLLFFLTLYQGKNHIW